MIKVFVYGSLMNRRSNFYFLRNAKFLGNTTIKGFDMFSYKNTYPYIKRGNNRVLGEVYEFDKKKLKIIDFLELNGYLYEREKITLELNKKIIDVWVYIGIHKIFDNGIRIKSGDWWKWKNENC